MNYGKELILDLHGCTATFDRPMIKQYFVILCMKINMDRCDLHFWDYEDYPEEYKEAPAHLKGISAIQFIKTSNITIHTLDEMKRVYLNIFSCKDFDPKVVAGFSQEWFGGKIINRKVVDRI